jgi:hypothetical protein
LIPDLTFELTIPEFNNVIRLKFDWDNMRFDKSSNYYNVYDFDSRFLLDELNPIVDRIQEELQIVVVTVYTVVRFHRLHCNQIK